MAPLYCLLITMLLWVGQGECTFGKTVVLQNVFSFHENGNLEIVNENQTDVEQQFTTTIILRDDTQKESLPPKAHGYVLLDDAYERLLPAKNDEENVTTVGVRMNINGITRIDSKAMIVGLEIGITLIWEDVRIKWPKGTPRIGESFLLDPSVLK